MPAVWQSTNDVRSMKEDVRCEDKILAMFFEKERWEYAIAKGVGKDVPKAVLYQLCKTEMRAKIYQAIRDGRYEIAPPHTALIPKDKPGEFRTVYVNEAADRVLLSIANDLLFELMPDMVHLRCKSYLRGVGCGRVVQEASSRIASGCKMQKAFKDNGHIGWKSDLSKYFDSVPIGYIDAAFDRVEERHGHSALIDVLRKYYHSDLYIDGETKQVCEKYQSLKQGCSVASWLADVILYHIDDKLARLDGYYVRYSDDMLFIGHDADKAMAILTEELAAMDMKLNPKKVEWLDDEHWFKFLGFSIKGRSISLSSSRIKRFQKEIEARTIRWKKHQPSDLRHLTSAAINRVNRYLYHGDGQGHSWATGVLPIVNVKEDIDTLNAFVMDCLRAVATGKTKLGGLGYCKEQKVGCISRGRGRNVSANRSKTGDDIGGYLSIGCMQNAMRTSRAAYDTLVRSLSTRIENGKLKIENSADALPVCSETIEELYDIYKHSIPSEKTMHRPAKFKALPESELSDEDMLYGVPREQAEKELEQALRGFQMPEDAGSWFWQSKTDRDLVVLRSWAA